MLDYETSIYNDGNGLTRNVGKYVKSVAVVIILFEHLSLYNNKYLKYIHSRPHRVQYYLFVGLDYNASIYIF